MNANISLIRRAGVTVLRVFQGCFESGAFIEYPLQPSEQPPTEVKQVRLGTREAVEVARAAEIKFDPDWDTMYGVSVGGAVFLLVETRKTGFSCYDGDYWYLVDSLMYSKIFGGLAEVQLGDIRWRKAGGQLEKVLAR